MARNSCRVAAEEQRVHVLLVHVDVCARGGRDVLRRIARGILGLEIEHDADLVRPAPSSVALDGGGMREKQVVRGDRRLEQIGVARRVHAVQVASVRDDPGLVQRRPHRHAIPVSPERGLGIVGEPLDDVRVEPAAAIVERGGQIPVIERDVRRDAAREQAVDEPRVEVDALRVHAAAAFGEEPRPPEAEAIGLKAQLAHQLDVAFPAAVVIAGHITRVAV